MNIFEEVQEVTDLAEKMLHGYLKDMEPFLSAKVPGTKRLDDMEFMQYVAKNRREYPPEPCISPKGEVFVESPAILAWQYIEEMKDEFRRYVKVFGEPPRVQPEESNGRQLA